MRLNTQEIIINIQDIRIIIHISPLHTVLSIWPMVVFHNPDLIFNKVLQCYHLLIPDMSSIEHLQSTITMCCWFP